MIDQAQMLRETVLQITGVNPRKCMQCGKCSGACPAYDEMEYRPHQFVAMVERGQIERLMESKSLYKCMTCFQCLERCPRNVEPARLIEAVRLMAIRRQGMNHLKPEAIPPAVDDAVPQQLFVSAMRKYSK